jgi:hypothetical protein
MSNDTHISVFIVESIHHPTQNEAETVAKEILLAGVAQGFEPFNVNIMTPEFNTTVEDRDIKNKWKRRT